MRHKAHNLWEENSECFLMFVDSTWGSSNNQQYVLIFPECLWKVEWRRSNHQGNNIAKIVRFRGMIIQKNPSILEWDLLGLPDLSLVVNQLVTEDSYWNWSLQSVQASRKLRKGRVWRPEQGHPVKVIGWRQKTTVLKLIQCPEIPLESIGMLGGMKNACIKD